MSLVRCPACQTVFRLQAEQLDAHGGMVRCGHCFVPFNARLSLVDHDAKPAADAPAATPAAVSHTTTAASEKPFFVLEDPAPATHEAAPPQSFAAALDALRRDDFVRPATPPAVFRSRSEADRKTAAVTDARDDADEAAIDPLDFGVPDALPPRPEAPAPPAPDEVEPLPESLRRFSRTVALRVEPATSLPPELAAHFVLPERTAATPHDAPPVTTETAEDALPMERADTGAVGRDTVRDHLQAGDDVPEPSARADAEEEGDDDDAMRARYRPAGAAAPTSSGGRWFLGLSLGMLMGLLAAQGSYLFRNEITRQWPPLRPYFALMCEHMECTLGLPRVIDDIVIESSDLEVAPGARNSHVLNAVIRNRASFPQTVPHLELTLTDARDRAVVRRVLAPGEWLRDTAPEAGLAPRTSVPVRLGFNTTGVDNAVGYRLYLFYP